MMIPETHIDLGWILKKDKSGRKSRYLTKGRHSTQVKKNWDKESITRFFFFNSPKNNNIKRTLLPSPGYDRNTTYSGQHAPAVSTYDN